MPIKMEYSILFSVRVTVSAAKVSVCRATHFQLIKKVLNGLHFQPKALSLIGHHHVLSRLFWICGKWEERIDCMRSSKQQKELTSSPEIPVIKLQGQVIILEMHLLILLQISILFIFFQTLLNDLPLLLSMSSVFVLVQLNLAWAKSPIGVALLKATMGRAYWLHWPLTHAYRLQDDKHWTSSFGD